MKESLTAVFEKSPHGYIGYIEELPGANTQGETLEETKASLIEAIQLVLQANQELAEEEIKSGKHEVVRESLGSKANLQGFGLTVSGSEEASNLKRLSGLRDCNTC